VQQKKWFTAEYVALAFGQLFATGEQATSATHVEHGGSALQQPGA
jgi:hypothetical protein